MSDSGEKDPVIEVNRPGRKSMNRDAKIVCELSPRVSLVYHRLWYRVAHREVCLSSRQSDRRKVERAVPERCSWGTDREGCTGIVNWINGAVERLDGGKVSLIE